MYDWRKHRKPGWKTSNVRELAVADWFSKQSWRVLRNGWPDFLMLQGDRIVAAEVKSDAVMVSRKSGKTITGGASKLSVAQVRVRRALQSHGIPVLVIRVNAKGQPVQWNQKARGWQVVIWEDAVSNR